MANPRKPKTPAKSFNTDGLENVLSRKGSTDSKSGANVFTESKALTYTKIRAIYKSGGIGAKVITRVADDITRKGFKVVGKPELEQEFDRLRGSQKFNQAIRWARAYGGAIIVMQIDDGSLSIDPVNLNKVRKIERLDVYEAGISNRVTIKEYYDDPTQESYGIPKIYSINRSNGISFDIHESRCIRIDGRPYDSHTRHMNNGWDGSELEPVYDALLSMYSQLLSGEQILDEIVIGVLKVENLDAHCADEDGERTLAKRIDLVDKSKSNENTIVVDINEDYVRHVANLSGVANVQATAMTVVAGSADIPATFLFGSSPDGQNATGESDKEQYYGKIEAERLYLLKPALVQLFSIISPNSFEIKFPSMRVSSLFDTARSIDSYSKSLVNMVTAQIISTEEAKQMFIASGLSEKISVLE